MNAIREFFVGGSGQVHVASDCIDMMRKSQVTGIIQDLDQQGDLHLGTHNVLGAQVVWEGEVEISAKGLFQIALKLGRFEITRGGRLAGTDGCS